MQKETSIWGTNGPTIGGPSYQQLAAQRGCGKSAGLGQARENPFWAGENPLGSGLKGADEGHGL